MLIIWTKIGEEISIGNKTVTLKVVDVYRGQVKFGFTADPAIPIHRAEVQRDAQRYGLGAEKIIALLADEKQSEVTP